MSSSLQGIYQTKHLARTHAHGSREAENESKVLPGTNDKGRAGVIGQTLVSFMGFVLLDVCFVEAKGTYGQQAILSRISASLTHGTDRPRHHRCRR